MISYSHSVRGSEALTFWKLNRLNRSLLETDVVDFYIHKLIAFPLSFLSHSYSSFLSFFITEVLMHQLFLISHYVCVQNICSLKYVDIYSIYSILLRINNRFLNNNIYVAIFEVSWLPRHLFKGIHRLQYSRGQYSSPKQNMLLWS